MRLSFGRAEDHRDLELDHASATATVGDLLAAAGITTAVAAPDPLLLDSAPESGITAADANPDALPLDSAPESRIAGIATAAAGANPDALFLDSVAVSPGTEMAGALVLEGSLIGPVPEPFTVPLPGWTAAHAGGLAAETVVPIPAGRPVVVGRSSQADIVLSTQSASWEHCHLVREEDGVRVFDAGSTNGTLVDGHPVPPEGTVITERATVTAGGCALEIRDTLDESPAPRPGSQHNVTTSGTVPFNRPPGASAPAEGEPIMVPARRDIPAASKFSALTVFAPLLLAGVMVVVLGDLRFALFAALSPVMGIAMWVEQRRRHGRNLAEEETRFQEDAARFADELVAAGTVECSRLSRIAPDVASLMRWATLPATALWHRRRDDPHLLTLSAGRGDVPWSPPLTWPSSQNRDPLVRGIVEAARLNAAPVITDLGDAGVVGIVGDREGCLALARSLLLQAVLHCGPADLSTAIFCDRGRAQEWDWTSWLPHSRQLGSATGERWISDDAEVSTTLLRGLLDAVPGFPTPAILLVLDSDVLTEGRDSPARTLLGLGRGDRPGDPGARVSGIVIAAAAEQLPSACTTVITVGADAAADVLHTVTGVTISDAIIAGIGTESARVTARALARLEDPELSIPGASLPGLVRLPDLLDVPTGGTDPDATAAAITRLWHTSTGVGTPIGLGESGALSLDLVADGPHGLVGGTTGSGKSEFLRSLVAGLAVRHPPTKLNFILIDFKGGAAFAACERFPHTIGTISNLDAQLADRALRSLEAEMQRRQRVFAEAGDDIDNLPAYLATQPAEPMPRLLLVVDEFAMLAREFPDVLSALVAVGTVGRTLGVHMILATQRPAGVVNDDILANTNLRVALRVQSKEDSTNVLSVPSAAAIGRAQTGRAFVKRGHDDIVPVQTALVTGAAPQSSGAAVDVRAVNRFGVPAPRPFIETDEETPADLDILIDATRTAHERAGYAAPRRVWPEPLGERVSLGPFAHGEDPAIPVIGGITDLSIDCALADEPELQRQSATGWDRARGNLLLIGVPGSGTSTTISSLILTASHALDPEELDLLILDMGAGELAPLADLPHTVAYVGPGHGARERQARFLRHLRALIARRRADPGDRRPTLVVVDGYPSLRDEFNGEDDPLLGHLSRAYAEGPALGVWCVMSITRPTGAPTAINEVTTQRWVFQLADSSDYSSLHVGGNSAPAPIAGRCVDVVTARQLHIATPDEGVSAAVAEVGLRWPGWRPKEPVIAALPSRVRVGELDARAEVGSDPWRVPIGLREEDLEPAVIEIFEGEHFLIGGPARSGRSSLLLGIAAAVRMSEPNCEIWGVHDRRSPLGDADLDRVATNAADLSALLADLHDRDEPILVLLDDIERMDDGNMSLVEYLNATVSHTRVIATGRAPDLRTGFLAPAKALKRSRSGLLLQPELDQDGDTFGVRLPRRSPVPLTTGRGYLCVGGDMTLIQALSPDRDPEG